MEDSKIYDDPNILLGEELPNTKKLLLTRSVSNNLPLDNLPNPEGLQIFKKWFHSGKGYKWREDWKYLSKLSTIDYIWIYSHFPDLILQTVPAKGTASFEVLQGYRTFYERTAIWMFHLAHTTSEIPSVLESEYYQIYKKDALLLAQELNLCNDILFNQDFELGVIFYKKAIFLWLWMQIAKTKQLMRDIGVPNPLHPSEIVSKRDANKQEQSYLNILDGFESQDQLDKVTLYGISGCFNNLPGLIFWEAAELANEDENLSKSLSNCVKAARSVHYRNTQENPDKFQLVYVYHCLASGIPKVFTTGLGKKLPPKQSPKRKNRL